jgi:DNA ligase-1
MTLLATLVAVSERVGDTRSRLAKVQELAAFLRILEPDEVRIGVQYLAGELPQGRVGVGPAVLHDAGSAPPADRSSLSLAEVDRAVTDLAALRGAGVSALRTQALRLLFAQAGPEERAFLASLLLGELRQGALAGVMLEAVAVAAEVGLGDLRRAVMYAPSIGAVAQAAFRDGVAGLSQFRLQLLSPVAPMLAQTATEPEEALRQLGGEAAFEWKLDGARIQLHKAAGTVRIYTRNLNEVGDSLPEILELAAGWPAQDLILDGEAIALDAANRPHPFQVTMRRFGRRLQVERLRESLPMHALFFDCLRIGGEDLTALEARERFVALSGAVPEALRVPRRVTASAAEARAFYESALAAGHEGVMAKSLDAPYEAGSRGASWLKIKRAHALDLVVLGAEWGHGRRTGWLSNLHLGAMDPGTGEYVMLGKTFKGLTDGMLEWQTRAILARETHRDRNTVYVRPELVVEVAFSDVQQSPRYPGGLALRLARVRRYREDKTAEQADTLDAVRRLFPAPT